RTPPRRWLSVTSIPHHRHHVGGTTHPASRSEVAIQRNREGVQSHPDRTGRQRRGRARPRHSARAPDSIGGPHGKRRRPKGMTPKTPRRGGSRTRVTSSAFVIHGSFKRGSDELDARQSSRRGNPPLRPPAEWCAPERT